MGRTIGRIRSAGGVRFPPRFVTGKTHQMRAGTDIITSAVSAARAGDLDALRRLVDWPLTGAAEVASALAGVDERDRPEAAASGLDELAGAERNIELVEEVLRSVAVVLAGTREVRVAEPREQGAVLAAVRVPDVPAGLPSEHVAQFDRLRARAARLSEVYVVSGDAGQMILARAADSGQLVLLLGPPGREDHQTA